MKRNKSQKRPSWTTKIDHRRINYFDYHPNSCHLQFKSTVNEPICHFSLIYQDHGHQIHPISNRSLPDFWFCFFSFWWGWWFWNGCWFWCSWFWGSINFEFSRHFVIATIDTVFTRFFAILNKKSSFVSIWLFFVVATTYWLSILRKAQIWFLKDSTVTYLSSIWLEQNCSP